MKRLPHILIFASLLMLVVSCNYIPFPCNIIPAKNSDFQIDPVERDDSHFEILRDTIISLKKTDNDSGLDFAGVTFSENETLALHNVKACFYNKKFVHPYNTFVKTSVTKEVQNNQQVVTTKKEIYTLEKAVLENIIAETETIQPVAVKVRKQTITVSKVVEES